MRRSRSLRFENLEARSLLDGAPAPLPTNPDGSIDWWVVDASTLDNSTLAAEVTQLQQVVGGPIALTPAAATISVASNSSPNKQDLIDAINLVRGIYNKQMDDIIAQENSIMTDLGNQATGMSSALGAMPTNSSDPAVLTQIDEMKDFIAQIQADMIEVQDAINTLTIDKAAVNEALDTIIADIVGTVFVMTDPATGDQTDYTVYSNDAYTA